ncbi:hypothetical protein A4G19_15795 [Pasteurellaceae bacterium Macca]|nr:hypothetical protein [Pasteurellaceae bacterium Macca]MCK3656189.1 hypothetical protein [Pasteurellaceae bacterium Macca]MCK3656407.1 hypothetical protein [Pasteurellaceae bacterium Macca]MCK3656499.1 hypothetical protein [Pasteurellaceae bacterium Macca]MCK3656673.1 hypothetical protein [Pasteurellaceae bacterium Macca]
MTWNIFKLRKEYRTLLQAHSKNVLKTESLLKKVKSLEDSAMQSALQIKSLTQENVKLKTENAELQSKLNQYEVEKQCSFLTLPRKVKRKRK